MMSSSKKDENIKVALPT
jgi:hypothetical protein